MKMVTMLRKGSLFGPMRSFLAMSMSSSSALRHRRQHAALRGMLAVMLVHASIVRRDMQMLAAPLRARIAEPDGMHHVHMQATFGPRDARDTLYLAVLYDVYARSAAFSHRPVMVV